MNEELRERYADDVLETLGHDARLVSMSKSLYRRAHPDHVVVFNSNVCLEEGKVWHGDIDLTLDEPKLADLSKRTGEIVHLLYEYDGRFTNEERPLLNEAVYSVTPSGHTKYDHRYTERAVDGTLRKRPPDPATQRRWSWTILRPRWPRLLHFWRLQHESGLSSWPGGDPLRTHLLYVGRARDGYSTPLLVLGFFHRRRPREASIELTWYPARPDETRNNAPQPLLDATPHLRFGRSQVWLRLLVWPAFMYELTAGYSFKRRWDW